MIKRSRESCVKRLETNAKKHICPVQKYFFCGSVKRRKAPFRWRKHNYKSKRQIGQKLVPNRAKPTEIELVDRKTSRQRDTTICSYHVIIYSSDTTIYWWRDHYRTGHGCNSFATVSLAKTCIKPRKNKVHNRPECSEKRNIYAVLLK